MSHRQNLNIDFLINAIRSIIGTDFGYTGMIFVVNVCRSNGIPCDCEISMNNKISIRIILKTLETIEMKKIWSEEMGIEEFVRFRNDPEQTLRTNRKEKRKVQASTVLSSLCLFKSILEASSCFASKRNTGLPVVRERETLIRASTPGHSSS